MDSITAFVVGETYTNDQIRFALDLENLGGIRPSLDASRNVRHVAIMTSSEESGMIQSENPYRDRIEGDILVYTAQGREGDQELTGRNKRLIGQYGSPTPFFGFSNIGRQTYRFLGLLELLRHYQEKQFDRKRSLRTAWVFEFRIHRDPPVIPIDQAQAISAALLGESRRVNALGSMERELEQPVSSPCASEDGASLEVEAIRSAIFGFGAYEFEHFIRSVLERSGFVQVSVTPASGDGGIDVNAYVDEEDDFFQGTHLQVQVKRWRHAVGSPDINSFRGALSGAAKGVFVTTSHFTRAARAEARHPSKASIALLDGERLAGVVIRAGMGTELLDREKGHLEE